MSNKALSSWRAGNRRSPGLGDAFVDIVRATVDDVITDSNRFAHLAPDGRYARVPRFPYVVLFDVHSDEHFRGDRS